jgi:hypothetical protein
MGARPSAAMDAVPGSFADKLNKYICGEA